MKNVLVPVLCVLLIQFKANCQIAKGDWLIGGNANFDHEKQTGGDLGDISFTVFDLSSKGGYFFVNRLAGGLKPSYLLERRKDGSGITQAVVWSLGPFIRYYIFPSTIRANVFLESSYAFGKGRGINSGNYQFLGGPVIFLNSSVAVELTFVYNVRKFNTGYNDRERTFRTGIGLQFYLSKEE